MVKKKPLRRRRLLLAGVWWHWRGIPLDFPWNHGPKLGCSLPNSLFWRINRGDPKTTLEKFHHKFTLKPPKAKPLIVWCSVATSCPNAFGWNRRSPKRRFIITGLAWWRMMSCYVWRWKRHWDGGGVWFGGTVVKYHGEISWWKSKGILIPYIFLVGKSKAWILKASFWEDDGMN